MIRYDAEYQGLDTGGDARDRTLPRDGFCTLVIKAVLSAYQ